LREEGGYHPKTDIWAFGCIAYEFFTKEKAFVSDWATRDYLYTCFDAPKKVFDDSQGWPKGSAVEFTRKLSKACVEKTLRIIWEERPSAAELVENLASWR
jgi:serine/threonine protein kinase